MINKKQIFHGIIALVLLCSAPVYAVDWTKIGQVFAGVGTALVAVGAAAIGYEWLTRPSDSDYISMVESATANVVHNNKEFMALFKTQLDWDYYTPQVRHRVLTTLSEECLYAIATLSDSMYGSPFPPLLKNDCHALESHVQELLKRIDALRKERYLSVEQQHNLNKMCMLLDRLLPLQEELTLFKDYLEKHVSYFDLATVGWQSFKNYAIDIELYELYKYDQYRFIQQLDVQVYKKYNNYQFPYVAYVEDLDQTITLLVKAKNRVAYNYSAMLSWVEQYSTQLRSIRFLVENRYQLQLLERERARIEKRRIQLEEARHALHLQVELERWEAERREVERLLTDLSYQIMTVTPATQFSVTVQL